MDTGADGLKRLYRHRFDEASREAKARLWKILVESFFQKYVKLDASVLDLGCGFGEFLNHVRCARRVGVDLNPEATRYLAKGVEFLPGDVCQPTLLPDASIDLVFSSNLMEHLPSKESAEQMLREVWRVLKPGGQVVLIGPNLRFLTGEYWDFWDHRLPITDRSLAEVLGSLDFSVVERRARFLPYTTRSALPQAGWLVRLYLHLPMAWCFFGRQFLLRAIKP
ncbi:MAG TPA: class I SAM-dependent methyltransferase [Planctomycetota bacterium]|jgi:SAM-dependent methyltransferase|nr:class I SAM-dependent methyltransferase [Planctomycetota bacterium]